MANDKVISNSWQALNQRSIGRFEKCYFTRKYKKIEEEEEEEGRILKKIFAIAFIHLFPSVFVYYPLCLGLTNL